MALNLPLPGDNKGQTLDQQKDAIEREFEKKIKKERRANLLRGKRRPLAFLAVFVLIVAVGGSLGLSAWRNLQEEPVDPNALPTTLPIEVLSLNVVRNATPAREADAATYDVLARISNADAVHGSADVTYVVTLLDAEGVSVGTATGSTFVEPESSRGIAVFRIGASAPATQATIDVDPESVLVSDKEVALRPSTEGVVHEVVKGTGDGKRSVVTGTLVNGSALALAEVELIVSAFDKNGKIVGLNGTVVSDVAAAEEREFEIKWREELKGVARVEVETVVDPFETVLSL